MYFVQKPRIVRSIEKISRIVVFVVGAAKSPNLTRFDVCTGYRTRVHLSSCAWIFAAKYSLNKKVEIINKIGHI